VEPTMRVTMLPLCMMLAPISGYLLHHCHWRKRGKVNREAEGFCGGGFEKEI
jgi:hypothetical protein